jgi:hypothetical protein
MIPRPSDRRVSTALSLCQTVAPPLQPAVSINRKGLQSPWRWRGTEGGDNDGAEGLQAIKRYGGRVIVQKPKEAAEPSIERDYQTRACL